MKKQVTVFSPGWVVIDMRDRFKGGKRHGTGTYHFASGNKYKGGWVDAQKTGLGIFTWPGGDRYAGQVGKVATHRRFTNITFGKRKQVIRPLI